MYWTFGLQAIYDHMNQLNCHLSRFGMFCPQELPINHMELAEINTEIPILYLECQWEPHKNIIFSMWYDVEIDLHHCKCNMYLVYIHNMQLSQKWLS